MPQSSPLTGLPPEILIGIFENLAMFKDLAAFAGTSHRLHSIWGSNAKCISEELQKNVIVFLDEATDLLKSHHAITDEGEADQCTTLEMNKRLISNAQVVVRASRRYWGEDAATCTGYLPEIKRIPPKP